MFWLQINLFSWNNYDTLYTWSLKRVDCDLQEMKHFSPCNCASCDLWEKLYSREKNAYKTDQKVFFCRITCGRRKEVGIEGFCLLYKMISPYLIFVTDTGTVSVEKKSVMWRNFIFLYMKHVEKAKNFPQVD